jgi:hypothetical protein
MMTAKEPTVPGLIRGVWKKLVGLLGKGKTEDPDDPFAMVGAPKKPRPPLRHSSVAIEPER